MSATTLRDGLALSTHCRPANGWRLSLPWLGNLLWLVRRPSVRSEAAHIKAGAALVHHQDETVYAIADVAEGSVECRIGVRAGRVGNGPV